MLLCRRQSRLGQAKPSGGTQFNPTARRLRCPTSFRPRCYRWRLSWYYSAREVPHKPGAPATGRPWGVIAGLPATTAMLLIRHERSSQARSAGAGTAHQPEAPAPGPSAHQPEAPARTLCTPARSASAGTVPSLALRACVPALALRLVSRRWRFGACVSHFRAGVIPAACQAIKFPPSELWRALGQ